MMVEAPGLAPPSPAPPSPVSPAPAVARADAAVVAPVTAVVVVALAAVATPPEMAPACEAAAANTGLETTDATAAVAARTGSAIASASVDAACTTDCRVRRCLGFSAEADAPAVGSAMDGGESKFCCTARWAVVAVVRFHCHRRSNFESFFWQPRLQRLRLPAPCRWNTRRPWPLELLQSRPGTAWRGWQPCTNRTAHGPYLQFLPRATRQQQPIPETARTCSMRHPLLLRTTSGAKVRHHARD